MSVATIVFTRPILSLIIPKMIPPVAQPRIIEVVAYPMCVLIDASAADRSRSSSFSADSRPRMNSR